MSEIKLKRCPFCGGEVELVSWGYSWDTQRGIECKCGALIQFSKGKEQLTELWNTRKPMERILERLEKQNRETKDICEELEDMYYLGMSRAEKDAINIVKEEGGINE